MRLLLFPFNFSAIIVYSGYCSFKFLFLDLVSLSTCLTVIYFSWEDFCCSNSSSISKRCYSFSKKPKSSDSELLSITFPRSPSLIWIEFLLIFCGCDKKWDEVEIYSSKFAKWTTFFEFEILSSKSSTLSKTIGESSMSFLFSKLTWKSSNPFSLLFDLVFD